MSAAAAAPTFWNGFDAAYAACAYFGAKKSAISPLHLILMPIS